ncbi:MAG: hypothetical protein V3R87_03580 [Dehalococcoidia bacterium]
MKYRVYAIATASWEVGTYEADTPEAAIKMADDDNEAEFHKSLCHQCAETVELGDCNTTEAEEISG